MGLDPAGLVSVQLQCCGDVVEFSPKNFSVADVVRSAVHHVQNSDQFAALIQDLTLQPDDIMASFEVVSLFTNVPTSDDFPEGRKISA